MENCIDTPIGNNPKYLILYSECMGRGNSWIIFIYFSMYFAIAVKFYSYDTNLWCNLQIIDSSYDLNMY